MPDARRQRWRSFGVRAENDVFRAEGASGSPLVSNEWLVLGASDAKGLVKWLTDNGYPVGTAEVDSLQDYVDRGWSFTVMRVKRASKTDEVLVPMRLSWPGATSELPLRIMANSKMWRVGATVWTLADQRQEAANYATMHLSPAALHLITPDNIQQGYDKAVEMTISEAGGRGFVIEYARPDTWVARALASGGAVELAHAATAAGLITAPVLTRLQTRMAPSALNADLQLHDTSNLEPVTGEVQVKRKKWAGDTGPDVSFGVVLLCVALLGTRRRRD